MLEKLKERYDLPVISVSLVVVIAFVAATFAAPDAMMNGLKAARDWVEYNLGALIKFFALVAIVYCAWMAFSKYGNIRFGKAKPKYSTWIWIVLIFCSSFSMSIMFWAVLEWAEYIVYTQPTGMDLEQTAQYSLAYLFHHWGLPVWVWMIVGALPMGYNYYVRKKGKLDMASTAAGVVGDKPRPWVKFLINFIFVYGAISALVISLGAGLPMLTHNLEPIFNIETGWTTTVIVALLVTAVYTLSAVSGIDRGIKRFSLLCTWLTIPLLVWIFVTGDPVFSINNTIQGFGIHVNDFFKVLLENDPDGQGTGFPQMWTVYYIAWWISAAPTYWIFIVKVSRGRSMRSIILVLAAAALISTAFFFGILTNRGLGELLKSGFDFSTIGQNGTIIDTFFTTQDDFGFVNDFLMGIPGGVVVVVVWFLASFFALTTMMDSSAFVLAEATSKGLKIGQDPRAGIRIFWAIIIMVIPMVILWAGADLFTIKCLLVISSVPVGIITAMGMVSLAKWVRKDFGQATAGEISAFFRPAEEAHERDEMVEKLARGIPEESAENDGASGAELLNPFHRSKKKGGDGKRDEE